MVGTRRRILVVDDTDTLRRFLVKMLNVAGHDAEGVETADELVEAVTTSPPDVVLLDWNLGRGKPSVLIDTLKSIGVPVVVITGDPFAVTRNDVPVLAKPINIAVLRRCIETLWHGADR